MYLSYLVWMVWKWAEHDRSTQESATEVRAQSTAPRSPNDKAWKFLSTRSVVTQRKYCLEYGVAQKGNKQEAQLRLPENLNVSTNKHLRGVHKCLLWMATRHRRKLSIIHEMYIEYIALIGVLRQRWALRRARNVMERPVLPICSLATSFRVLSFCSQQTMNWEIFYCTAQKNFPEKSLINVYCATISGLEKWHLVLT